MTSGIYRLGFNNGSTYVGQAKDIQKRWDQHFNDLLKGKHAKALQNAYYLSNHTLPVTQTILECDPTYLDIYETYYIHLLEPDLNHQIPKPLDPNTERWMVILADSGHAKLPIGKLVEEVHSGNLAKTKLNELEDKWDDRVALEAAAIEGHEEALEQLEKLRWAQ